MALKRLQAFLEYEEKDRFDVKKIEAIDIDLLQTKNLAVLMKNVSVGWVDRQCYSKVSKNVGSYKSGTQTKPIELNPFKLEIGNLEIPKGKLIFVIGAVGAGTCVY